MAAVCTRDEVSAQICDGRGAFNVTPVQLELRGASTTDGMAVGASAGFGSDQLFAAGSISRRTQSGVDDPEYGFAGIVGTDQPISPDNRFHACPIAGIFYTGWSGSMRLGVMAGGSAGMLARNDTTLAVIPTLGLSFRTTIGDTAIESRRASLFHRPGIVTFGVGLVVRNRVSFQPAASLAFGGGGATPGLHVAVSYNLARRQENRRAP
ncbi:MAG: hypothetical protein GEU82_12880 [Luteitalea sp.]|nr:hypothetical protein [Luteitalea sp.]